MHEPLKTQLEWETKRHLESPILGGGRETFISHTIEESPQTNLINCGFGDEDVGRVGAELDLGFKPHGGCGTCMEDNLIAPMRVRNLRALWELGKSSKRPR
ncbi:hypothetical protein ACSQ67_016427 [Phaseolus vulgaris]